MRWVVLLIASAVTLTALVDDADARGRRYRRRHNNYYSQPSYSSRHWGSSPAEVADAKARHLASQNSMYHPGGGYGGANAEGVGAGMSAAQALGNCCFSGARPLAASACYQGSNGMFYAVKLFY